MVSKPTGSGGGLRSLHAAAFTACACTAAVTLMGCGQVMETFVSVACKTTVNNYIDKVQLRYINYIVRRCATLREAVEEQSNGTQREEVEQDCLDKAGVDVATDIEASKENYTKLCTRGIVKATNMSMNRLKNRTQELIEGKNNNSFSLESFIEEHLNRTFDELLRKFGLRSGAVSTSNDPDSSENYLVAGNETLRLVEDAFHVPEVEAIRRNSGSFHGALTTLLLTGTAFVAVGLRIRGPCQHRWRSVGSEEPAE